jgi:hypothetical protein
MLKIPFGKHKETGHFYDAGAVPNGLKCDCLCNECGTSLEAVHPKLPNRQNYFRHASNSNCKGGLESLFHLVAKQILKESKQLQVSVDEVFSYDKCEIETSKHGKQPDAYVSNNKGSLIVEIFFWHRIDRTTLDTYLKSEERVLEIDISGERKKVFNYDHLKDLILWSAPREIHKNQQKLPISRNSNGSPWWMLLFLLFSGFLLFWWTRKRRRK